MHPGLITMDLLYAACIRPPGCSDVFIAGALDCSMPYDERLECVRFWAKTAVSHRPVSSIANGYSPRLTDDGTMNDWLTWARSNEMWARAAAHAIGKARLHTAFPEFTLLPAYAHRSALARFLVSYSNVATLATSGQAYLNAHIRVSCPAYITALSGGNAFAHASEQLKDSINRVMGGVVHRTVAAQYRDVHWATATHSHLLLAIAILGDAVGNAPVYLNADLLSHTGDTPAFAVLYDLDGVDTVGVMHQGTFHAAHSSFIDTIGYWLTLQLDNGLHHAFSGEKPPPARLAAHIRPAHSH